MKIFKSEKIKYIRIDQIANINEEKTDSTLEESRYIDAHILELKSIARNISLIKPLYKFLFRLKNNLNSQRRSYNSHYRLIRNERPSMIVTLNDQNELMMMNIARRLGIDTITLGWSMIASSFYYAKIHLREEYSLKQWHFEVIESYCSE